MRAEVKGLTGGNKHLYLRHHRTEILEFFGLHGLDATLEEFNLSQNTFDRFLVARTYNDARLTKAERALDISKMAIEATRDNRRRIIDMQQQLDRLEPMARIASGFMLAAVQVAAQNPDLHEYIDQDIFDSFHSGVRR